MKQHHDMPVRKPGRVRLRHRRQNANDALFAVAPVDRGSGISVPGNIRQPVQAALQEASHEIVQLTLEGFTLDEATLVNSSMLPYLAMVASVIEGRSIGAEELLHVLRKSMRQRSFDRLPRREYVLRFHDQHPP